MIKINPNPQFTEEVEITVPGQKETGTITLTFKYRSMKGFNEWTDSLKEDKKGGRKAVTLLEAFEQFVLGWDLPEEFTTENIEIFIDNYPASYSEIFSFYAKSLFESRVKN